MLTVYGPCAGRDWTEKFSDAQIGTMSHAVLNDVFVLIKFIFHSYIQYARINKIKLIKYKYFSNILFPVYLDSLPPFVPRLLSLSCSVTH